MYIYIYLYICTYISVYVFEHFTRMCVSIFLCNHAYMCLYLHTHIAMYTEKDIHIVETGGEREAKCTGICIHTCTDTCIRTRKCGGWNEAKPPHQDQPFPRLLKSFPCASMRDACQPQVPTLAQLPVRSSTSPYLPHLRDNMTPTRDYMVHRPSLSLSFSLSLSLSLSSSLSLSFSLSLSLSLCLSLSLSLSFSHSHQYAYMYICIYIYIYIISMCIYIYIHIQTHTHLPKASGSIVLHGASGAPSSLQATECGPLGPGMPSFATQWSLFWFGFVCLGCC